MHPELEGTQLREGPVLVAPTCACESGAVAVLRIGEAVVAVATLEARIAGLLAGRHAAKERLESPVYAQNNILQDLTMDGAVLRAHLFDRGQLGLLFVVADRLARHAVGVASFLKGSVVQLLAVGQQPSKLLGLLMRR